jgi:hypothetical protein
MAKNTSSSRHTTTRGAGSERRDLVRRPGASAYAKRTSAGRFKEKDDVGRSQKTDKPRKAKVRSGYGDQGDAGARAPRARQGLHVVIPIKPAVDWTECLLFSRRVQRGDGSRESGQVHDRIQQARS